MSCSQWKNLSLSKILNYGNVSVKADIFGQASLGKMNEVSHWLEVVKCYKGTWLKR